jgi:hypothetical protein
MCVVLCSIVWPRNRLLQMRQRFWSSKRNSASSLHERTSLVMDACTDVFSETPVCADGYSVHWLASVLMKICHSVVTPVNEITSGLWP